MGYIKMNSKAKEYSIKYVFIIVILLLTMLPLVGCQAEALTSTVIEKNTVTSMATKIETSTITNMTTVTTTKTVTVLPTTSTSVSSSTSTTSLTTSVIPNDQPQKITSDDGNLQILKHELVDQYLITPYGVYVTGVVKNLSSSTVNAEITIEFYNTDDVLLEAKIVVVTDLAPGKSTSFLVWASDTGRTMHPSQKYKIAGLKIVS